MRHPLENALARCAAAAVAVLMVSACSGAEPLSIGEFMARANDECTSLRSASDAFRKAQDPAFTGAQVNRFIGQVADRLRALVTDLDELEPPDSMRDDVDQLLGVLSEYADGLDELGDKVAPGQTFQGVLEESEGAVNRLNELATEATELVGILGLVGCLPTA